MPRATQGIAQRNSAPSSASSHSRLQRYDSCTGQVALRTAGLTKRYGRAVVIDGLDLKVGGGEVHAFPGPNGAGPPAAD
jgi:ATPase subunit of ABC transporter with duplicated ATPase domains